MEQTLISKVLFGEELSKTVEQHNELIAELALLKLKCPKVWWALEGAIFDSYYHRTHCVPFFKQFPLAKEEWKKDKEELAKLREEVINLREDVAKLKAAKRKKSKAKK